MIQSAGFLALARSLYKQGVIHKEGHSAARFHSAEGIAVVFHADDVDGKALFVVHLVQQLFRGRTGGHGHVLALQVVKVLDARIFVDQQAGADDEEGVGEVNLLLTFQVIGGRAAFKVKRAVLNQGECGSAK